MFYIRIADTVIGIENRYEYVEQLCRGFRTSEEETPLFTVCVTEEELLAEQNSVSMEITPDYAESVCVYRQICCRILKMRKIFLLHSTVIEYEGKGYAFAAPSGTGKTTHALLWRKYFGEKVHMINGDKPLMGFCDGRLIAYGTPWCGKEGWSENASVSLHAICFLQRSDRNNIRRLSPREAVLLMLSQILMPHNTEEADILFPLIEKAVSTIPCYVLSCNKKTEAAAVAYAGMNGGYEEI